tara:strand:+ start:6045 stop:6386 length:342 start_codon:yes stop_codon:yes gene_type:complete
MKDLLKQIKEIAEINSGGDWDFPVHQAEWQYIVDLIKKHKEKQMKVYVLKARYYGEEDDVFLFDSRQKAEEAAFDYFHRFGEERQEFESFYDFVDYLADEEIGYLSIYNQEVQ